jgi:hypothetical protein
MGSLSMAVGAKVFPVRFFFFPLAFLFFLRVCRSHLVEDRLSFNGFSSPRKELTPFHRLLLHG